MIQRFSMVIVMFFLVNNIALAEQCSAVFSDGIQSNNNSGQLTFNSGSRVTNSPDNILDSNAAIVDGSGGVSCNTGACSSSGNITVAINYTNFPNNNNNVSVASTQTLAITPGDYNNISLGSSATLNVMPGDYLLSGKLSAEYSSNINIIGSGVVRFFVKKTVNIDGSAKVNVGGQATNLLIYARQRFDILSSAEVTGFVYSNQDVTVQSNAVVNGSISGKSILLKSASTVNFETTEPEFGDFCTSVPPMELAGHYAMDEDTWLSGANPVIDSVNAINGAAFNGANTVGSTCRYGQFDGVDDYVQIPHDNALNGSDALTYVAYIRPDSWTGLDQIMAKSVHGGGSGRAQMGIFSENGVFKVRAETVGGRIEINDSLPVLAGDWVHVAAVFSSTSLTLYIDGVNVSSTSFAPTTLKQTTDPLNISKRVGTDVYYFHGLIDDVRVYTSPLTQQQIIDLKDSVEPCLLNPLDHFEISHDGQGLTCEAENVTIKACANADCSTLNNDAIDVQLSINGTFDKTVTVSGGSSNTDFSYTNANTATISLDQTYECKNGGSTSCDVTFADAGFRFLYGALESESTTIANQISGDEFIDVVKVQAVENVNGVCTGLFSGNKNVELSQQNIAPGGTAGLNFKINGAAGANIDKFPTYTPDIPLNFGADSKAIIPIPVYLDAGQIRLHAKYNVDGVSLVGNSNDFWVSPDHFVVTAQSGLDDLSESTSSGAITHKAGNDFSIEITAYNSLTAPTITQNYYPNSNNSIEFSATRTGPVSGFNGVLSVNGQSVVLGSDLSGFNNVLLASISFVNGTAIVAANYSEVGLLQIQARDKDYGNNSEIYSLASNVGRFIPDHFKQTVVEHGSLDTVCNQNIPFVYMGQKLVNDTSKGAISYLVNPVVELTAQNFQGGITTNYTEAGYNKFNAAANFIVQPTADSTITGKDTNPLPLTADMYTGIVSHNGLVDGALEFGIPLAAGVLHYELADEDNFLYPHNENSEINAQDNDIDFVIDQVNFVDSDGVGINSPVNITDTIGINLRFGRAYLENSFGPETADLPQPFSVQYLNTGGVYVMNVQDSCTHFDSNKITLTSGTLNKNLTSVNAVSGQLENGETRAMLLTAPGAQNQGTIGVEYDIYDWLKYDWDWDGVEPKVFDKNPNAVATFGLFRGNDRIIYQREVNN